MNPIQVVIFSNGKITFSKGNNRIIMFISSIKKNLLELSRGKRKNTTKIRINKKLVLFSIINNFCENEVF